jgi:carboxyl-terminal processing protease
LVESRRTRQLYDPGPLKEIGRSLYWPWLGLDVKRVNMGAKFKVVGLLAVGAIAGALTTMQLQANARSTLAPLPLEELQQLAAVFGMVKSDYVESVDEKKLINDAIAGMVAGLDPHSQYFDKKSFKEFRESTGGKFVGIGIEMGMEDGAVKVVSPIEGSPAFRAGLKPGDLITRIDDTPVKGLSVDQAVKRMRGEPNTKVNLTVFRKTESRTFPVTIVREEIRMQSVRAKMIEPGFGWVRVSQFQDRTVDDFVRKVEELYKQDPNLKGLVLDLRNDPGGLLDAAVALSAAFLPADLVVVSTKGQIAESQSTFRASPEYYARRGGDPLKRLPAALKTVPLVVLVNEGSASASEIVAGALQDHKRATIMGAQTFGKGSVQTVRPLSADTALKITTARYYTPSGRSIQAKGIVPDVWLDETADGNVFAALRMREADLEKHLTGVDEKKDAAREKAREEARQKLEDQAAKNKEPPKPLPEFGTPEDFPLMQALNQLRGKPVVVSKTMSERKAEADITAK